MNTKHIYDLSWNKGSHQVIDCKICGFEHLYPLPIDKELNHFYREKYYKDVKPREYRKLTIEEVQERKVKANLVQSYMWILSKVEAFIDHKGDMKPTMVDVGCGNDLLSLYF